MQTLDEKPETIHLYVVREKEPKPSIFTHRPLGSLFDFLYGLLCFNPYQQPEVRAVIRVPAVLLPFQTFSTRIQSFRQA